MPDAAANENDPPPPGACPTCGRPAVERYRPFCSKRCADVDLNRWLSGRYAIPGEEGPGAEDEGRDG